MISVEKFYNNCTFGTVITFFDRQTNIYINIANQKGCIKAHRKDTRSTKQQLKKKLPSYYLEPKQSTKFKIDIEFTSMGLSVNHNLDGLMLENQAQ